ncbi:MAG: hypothetical protein RL660_10 [Bacteroidota bacterium]|jgi:hypothetical protein
MNYNKIVLIAIAATSLLTSCMPTLYTPPAQPVAFLHKQDGTALQGGVAISGNTASVRASITKPVSDGLSLHAGYSKSVAASYTELNNPYEGGTKRDGQYNLGAGFNLTKKTGYPMQLWVSLQGGRSRDSYMIFPTDKVVSTDVLPSTNPADSIFRFEYVRGGYVAPRIGLSTIWLSNYDNNYATKLRKRMFFDVVGNLAYSPMRYKYSNGLAFDRQTNNIANLGAALRVGNRKFMLSANTDWCYGMKGLTDEIIGKTNDGNDFWQMSTQTFSLNLTWMLGRKTN